ncbi:uncharacterized protein PADG_01027 [Paracoccidioides brasiliensis Pb18]|uniref:PHD and RING finger domain-containing protein n=1 Tax=Paracoccidioides brasiliensis (strain Pb18) TaxID=502780 RepID=C1FZ01_PARBD|nr:uncharacterized protein PADG_01027 [Paracoccidioides brasiliensis Pb18]EEH44738.1 hypothetical protein PADG_01027 [Paracoccidioides brasiliensis Pb18]
MTDTCIVCLGDLGDGASEPARVVCVDQDHLPRSGDLQRAPRLEVVVTSPKPDPEADSGKIAHLLPCGHTLHDECLKPWVERANSCPICRQNFNMVELTDTVGGPVVSSYCVEDRVQVADIDPSIVVDELDAESDSQPCPICGYDDNEDVLLLCDGCDVAIHTYCVGLDAVPSGPWFCSQCETQRVILAVGSRPRNQSIRRTRGDQRRIRSRNQINAVHWARVWQTVWDHLNLDLDFPFDDERAHNRAVEQRRREVASRREFRAWERRFQIAERQGMANRFRDTASALLEIGRGWPSRPRQRIETPEPESLDEVRAWNAFERAREIQDDPSSSSSRGRKRKSPTASPVEPQPAQPERRLKRPRTRRPEALAADFLDHGGESSRAGRSANAGGSAASGRVPADSNVSTGPSFLQSLLKEVEDSSPPSLNNSAFRSNVFSATPGDSSSPHPSSPAQSSLSSNRSSPQPSSTTPPPYNNGPTTPITVPDPAAFSFPEFSLSCSPNQDQGTAGRPRLPRQMHRSQRGGHSSSSSPSRSRSNETSPTRSSLSISVKSDLQRMVSAALKPHYRSREISKDEYTDINRRISRMMYEKVGAVTTLDADVKSRWSGVASEEVSKAIANLKETREVNWQGQQGQ